MSDSEPPKHVEVPDRLRAIKRRVPTRVKASGRSAVRLFTVATASHRLLPTFLLVGAKRGGTTSLWNWLQQHPGVLPMVPAVQQIKSPHYFDIHYSRGERWYRSHFPTTAAYRLAERRLGYRPALGDASPYYMFHPLVPERAAAAVPGARILITLRDPVERALSNFRERRGSGAEPLTDFVAALDAEADRTRGEEARICADPTYYSYSHDNHTYLARGRYAEQLQRWLQHFRREQVLILQAEAMYRDPGKAFRRVEDFLGVAHHDVRFEHHHKLPGTTWDPDVRRRLTEYYAPYNETLYELLGERYDWLAP